MNTKQSAYLKIGLVVFLTFVFILAVGNSIKALSGSSSLPSRQKTVVAETPPDSNPITDLRRETTKRPWPVFELAEIIAYDPFAIAFVNDGRVVPQSNSALPEAGKETGQTSLDSRARNSVETDTGFAGRIQAVYQRGGRSAAIINSQVVRPGDSIQGTGRIVEVDQTGITLEVQK